MRRNRLCFVLEPRRKSRGTIPSIALRRSSKSSMKKNISLPQITPVEREADNEARRLIEHIENSLALVAIRSHDDADSIETAADRIESAARDLVGALRELARERSAT